MAGPGVYVGASFGGVDLLVTNVGTETGRDVAVHSPARGDIHVLQDRGKKLLSTTCTILFVDQPGKPNFLLRFDQLKDLAEEDGVSVFSHPLIGSYLARLTDFSFRAEEGAGTITCTAKFLAENEPDPILRTGAGSSAFAGLEAVTAAMGTTTKAAADLGLTFALPTDILGTVADWVSGDELDSQSVFADLATISGEIGAAIDNFALATDLSRWQLYRAVVQLGYQVGRAAEAVTSEASQVFDVFVAVPQPAIALAARLYGSALATLRAETITRINRLRTPGLIPAGTTLKCPSDGASP